MRKQPIDVLIADDHHIVSEGLQLCLGREDGLRVVGTAASGQDTIDRCLELRPDVLLLDIRMPDIDGLTALEAIRRRLPKMCVIVLTSYTEPLYLARAFSLGVAGFLSKEIEASQLAEAVYAAWSGDTVIDRSLLRRILLTCQELQQPSDANTPTYAMDCCERLTDQELRVLRLIGLGFNNAAISEALVVSRNTVKKHVHHILAKLDVADRTQAAIWALHHGVFAKQDLVQPPSR